jgi:hypothetical protein
MHAENNGMRIVADEADRADRSMGRESASMQTQKSCRCGRDVKSLAQVRTIRIIRSIRTNPYPVVERTRMRLE